MTSKRTPILALAALALVIAALGTGPARASGQSAFEQECGDCHSAKAGRNKKGPSLAGVVGRRPGSLADFDKYSDAMKAMSAPWSPDRIAAYIRNPRAVVRGGTMKYDGLSDEALLGEIVSYVSGLK